MPGRIWRRNRAWKAPRRRKTGPRPRNSRAKTRSGAPRRAPEAVRRGRARRESSSQPYPTAALMATAGRRKRPTCRRHSMSDNLAISDIYSIDQNAHVSYATSEAATRRRHQYSDRISRHSTREHGSRCAVFDLMRGRRPPEPVTSLRRLLAAVRERILADFRRFSSRASRSRPYVKGTLSFTPRTMVERRPMLRQIVIEAETPAVLERCFVYA